MSVLNNNMFGAAVIANAAAGGGGSAYQIEKSLRFNSGDTPKLSRTFTLGDTRTLTWSGWVKRNKFGAKQSIFGAPDTGNTTDIEFDSSDRLIFTDGGSVYAQTTAVFRDPSAWYHIVFALNANAGLLADRCKLYVNGELQDVTTQNYGQGGTSDFGTAGVHTIGSSKDVYSDVLLADVHYIDGLALGPAAFGSFDSTGVWNPKAFAPPAPNDGTTWSSGVTSETGSFYSGNEAAQLFDGNTSGAGNSVDASAQGKWVKWTPSSGKAFTTSVRIHHGGSANDYTLKLNDGRIIGPIRATTNAWNTLYEGKGTIEYIQNDPDGSVYNNWGAIEIDGVMLVDGKTDPTTRNNPNTDRTWSSSTTNVTNPANAFDGSVGTNSSNSSAITLTFSPSLTDVTSFEYYTANSSAHLTGFNGGTAANDGGGAGWRKPDQAVPSTISSVEMAHVSGSSCELAAVKVNGHVLIDDADDNSFHLKFNNTSALGTDSFSNGNWSVTNLSVTAGTGNDSLTDSPTNYGTDAGAGGEVRGNYATFSPFLNGGTLTNGNLDATSGANKRITSDFAFPSGKWYWEVTLTNNTVQQFGLGSLATANTTGSAPGDSGHNSYIALTNGQYYHNGSMTGSGLATTTTDDVLGFAFDADSRKFWISKNGSWQGSGSPNPATGADPLWTVSASYAPYAPTVGAGGADAVNCAFNAGQRAFEDTAPSGFKALCTANLPDTFSGDDVNNPSKYFDITTYTGSGATVTRKPFSFQPDLVWFKGRSDSDDGHELYDAVRGATKGLYSHLNNQEGTESTGLTAFTDNGFTTGAGGWVNTDDDTYVAWAWDTGTAAASTSNSGSATNYTRWTNATAGFSVIKATISTGSGYHQKTVDHGLGVPPEFIIGKGLDAAEDWLVYHSSIGTAGVLNLNDTGASDTSTSWKYTATSNSQFTFDSYGAATNMIYYVWAPIAGYSAFGSYEGNTNANGPFVYTGFQPRYLLLKSADGAYDWHIMDTTRNPSNGTSSLRLKPNTNAAEVTGSVVVADLLSNGFKIRNDDNNWNLNTILYMAFAEHPFKTSRAR